MAKKTTRRATAGHVLQVLHSHSLDVFRHLRLGVRQAQLSMPNGDKGPRIKVSLLPGSRLKLPSRLTSTLGERSVRVPLEVAEDFQPYSPQ
jgi:hypothetical protein